MKKPSFQFYPGDWMKDPRLSMCQAATRGIWIDLLCAMHENGMGGEISGTVAQLARICRCSPEELDTALIDLSVTKAADVTKCNGHVTVVCRRVKKESEARQNGAKRVERFRKKQVRNENVTTPSSSSTSVTLSSERVGNGFVTSEAANAIESYREPIRAVYGSTSLSNEQRWFKVFMQADEEKILPEELAKCLRELMAQKRDYPVTPENVITRAIEKRARKNLASPQPIGSGTDYEAIYRAEIVAKLRNPETEIVQ